MIALDTNWIAVKVSFRTEDLVGMLLQEKSYKEKHDTIKMMNSNYHTFHQDEKYIYVTKLRGQVKTTMMADYGAGFITTYEK